MGPAVTGPARQHPGASDATRHVLIPGAGAIRQADIIELILADHRRIRRLCDALYDTARYDGGPRPDWMLGPMWQRLADLLVAHTQAEEETCYLPLFGTGAQATERMRDSIADHDEIRRRAASGRRTGRLVSSQGTLSSSSAESHLSERCSCAMGTPAIRRA